jgi:hypothetical protein
VNIDIQVLAYAKNLLQQDFGCDEKFPITYDWVSHLLPAYNEDRIVRVYVKKPKLVSAHKVGYFVFIIFISFRMLMKHLVLG